MDGGRRWRQAQAPTRTPELNQLLAPGLEVGEEEEEVVDASARMLRDGHIYDLDGKGLWVFGTGNFKGLFEAMEVAQLSGMDIASFGIRRGEHVEHESCALSGMRVGTRVRDYIRPEKTR